jgi:hypothetical protein
MRNICKGYYVYEEDEAVPTNYLGNLHLCDRRAGIIKNMYNNYKHKKRE